MAVVQVRATSEVEAIYRVGVLACTALLLAVSGCATSPFATSSSGAFEPASASATPIPSATAAPSAPVHDLAGHILYAHTVGMDEHITFIANADGTDERQVAQAGVLSPDRTRFLLFMPDSPNSATGTAATIGVDGEGYALIPLRDPTLNLVPQTWAPDGIRVAFEGWDASHPGRNGIYTARVADGGDIVRVTSHEGPHDIPADYSPDGTKIVFFRSAVLEPAPWDLGGALWIVYVDGSDARRIETPGMMPSPGAQWSPDGTRILFSTARAQDTGALWTVDADGSNLTRIFQDSDPKYAHGRYAAGPIWSPDGSQIMFVLNPMADWFTHPANGIYVINADGTGLAEVIRDSAFKTLVDWWP